MKLLIEDAKRLISMNSVTAHGNEEIANYLYGLCVNRGLKTTLQQVGHSNETLSKRQFNLIGILGDPLVDRKTLKGLLMTSPLDTPTPGHPEFWDRCENNPWSPKIMDEALYGLGATSGKIDFLCKLYAIDRFREKKLKQPIYLLGTCASEAGMLGAQYLIKSMHLNPKSVMVYAPTKLKLLKQSKALAQYQVSIDYQSTIKDARGFNRRIDFHTVGRSAHSCNPAFGKNAVQEMLGFLSTATENGFEIRVTRIEGGDSFNKVPDYAFCQFYLTSYQFEDFKPFFREIAKQTSNEKSFRVELGGLGDVGVQFLPNSVVMAMYEMVQFFNEVGQELLKVKNIEFNPDHSTINLSRIQRGSQGLNLQFDLRAVPEIPLSQLNEKLLQGVKEIGKNYPDLNISMSRQRMIPAYQLSTESPLFQKCIGILEDEGEVLCYRNEINESYLFQQAGYDSVSVGPGGTNPGNSHAPNDFIELSEIEKGVEYYVKAIERSCL